MQALARSLPLLVSISITLIVFAVGLLATMDDLRYLWSKPRRLVRAIMAVDVFVPIIAVVIVRAFRLSPNATIALMLMAGSPVAPFAPRTDLKRGGRLAFVFSLSVTLTLLSIITVPLTLVILEQVFGVAVGISMVDVAKVVSKLFLAPAAVGMVVRAIWPSSAKTLSRITGMVGGVLIVLIGLLILVLSARAMAALGISGLLAATLLASAALFIGDMAGGPNPGDRTSLALVCAARNPGLALMVAERNFPNQEVAPAVVEYIVVATLLSAVYAVVRRARHGHLVGMPRPSWSGSSRNAARRRNGLSKF